MYPILSLLIWAINVYIWIIIITVIISWMVAFDVLNTRNKWVYKFCEVVNALTNPLILRIRKHVPPIANMDFSPLIAIFGLMLVEALLRGLMY
jgi:YggT family protein